MSFFQVVNFIEAALWAAIGIGFAGYALLPRTRYRATALFAAATFLAFGLSDVVETHTGAWWRPWWLLAWKGFCVVTFLLLLIRHVTRNTSPPSSATASRRPARA